MTIPFRLIRSTGAHRPKRPRYENPRGSKARLGVESLEGRTVPAVFTVNSLQDTAGSVDGLMTLRQAINSANATPGPNTIVFAPGMTGTVNLTLPTSGNPDGSGGELPILGPLTIEGPGANLLTVNQTVNDRVFDVLAGSDATVVISGISITGGSATDGGGVRNAGGAKLNLKGVSIDGNTATGSGGGVALRGTVAIQNSAISSNSANTGGGVQVFSGQTTIENTVISTNSATSSGGGVAVGTGASATLRNSTVTNNAAPAPQGSGINSAGGPVTVQNSNVAGNSGTDTAGAVQTSGRGLVGNGGPAALLPNTVINLPAAPTTATSAPFLNPSLGPLTNITGTPPALQGQAPVTSADPGGSARGVTESRGTARIITPSADIANTPVRDSYVPTQQRRMAPPSPPQPMSQPATPQSGGSGDGMEGRGTGIDRGVLAAVTGFLAGDGGRSGVSVVAVMDVDDDGVPDIVLGVQAGGNSQAVVVINGSTGLPLLAVPPTGSGGR